MAWSDDDLLTGNDLAKLLGVASAVTIDRMVEERTCPRPTIYGKQKRWRWRIVRQWMDAVEFMQTHGLQIPANGDKSRHSATNDEGE